MHRILLILAVSLVWIWGYGLTIEVADYGYGDGKIRNYREGPWTGTHTWAYGTYTVSGKVLSEGQVSTPLGSYPAVLVRYYYQTDVISYYNYQWETRGCGIIAYTMTLNNGMPYILNQADPNVANEDHVATVSSLKASIGPNPFTADLSLALVSKNSYPVSVSIYDLKGRLVSRSEHTLKAETELSLDLSQDFVSQTAGIYFISIKAGEEKLVRKVTIRKPIWCI